MHKDLEFLKKPIEVPNKIIFLDIKGVLQPEANQERFEHDLEGTCKMLASKYNDDNFLKLDKYDVGAVYYDWDYISVGILHQLLRETKSNIVISSDWRDSIDFSGLKSLFKLHNLDDYIIGVCDRDMTLCGDQRVRCIKKYISENTIDKYAVVDDLNLFPYFGENYRKIIYKLTIDDFYYLKLLLNSDIGLKEKDNFLPFDSDLNISQDIKVIDGKAVLFLKIDKLRHDSYKYRLEYLLNYLINQKDYDLCVFDNKLSNIDDLRINGYKCNDFYYIYKDKYCSNEIDDLIRKVKMKSV